MIIEFPFPEIKKEQYPFMFHLGYLANNSIYVLLKMENYGELYKDVGDIKAIAKDLEDAEKGFKKLKKTYFKGSHMKYINTCRTFIVIFMSYLEVREVININKIKEKIIEMRQNLYFLYNRLVDGTFKIHLPKEKLDNTRKFLRFLSDFSRRYYYRLNNEF